jgi:hypothetical protein
MAARMPGTPVVGVAAHAFRPLDFRCLARRAARI